MSTNRSPTESITENNNKKIDQVPTVGLETPPSEAPLPGEDHEEQNPRQKPDTDTGRERDDSDDSLQYDLGLLVGEAGVEGAAAGEYAATNTTGALTDLVGSMPDQTGGAGTEQVTALVPAEPVQPAGAKKVKKGRVKCPQEKCPQKVRREKTVTRRVKCPREVQVMIYCEGREQGFVRSITARSETFVPELRKNLYALKAAAKLTPLTYAQVKERLHELRSCRWAQGATPGQSRAVPEDRTAAEDQPPASAWRADQRSRRRRTGQSRSRAAGSVKDFALSRDRRAEEDRHAKRLIIVAAFRPPTDRDSHDERFQEMRRRVRARLNLLD